MPKSPNVDSAAATARVISRLLRRSGFTMSDKADRFRWTEGFGANRVGYSSEVSVYYRLPTELISDVVADNRRRAELERVRTFLRAKGYPLNHCGWVVCKGE